MSDREAEAKRSMQLLENRLTARLARLERVAQRRRWTMGALLVGLVGSLSLSAAMIFDPGLLSQSAVNGSEIRAHRFVLQDADQNVRGVWQLDEEGAARLKILDSAGRARMNLSVLPDGAPGISLADDSDRRRVVLGLLPDQTSTLVFADGGGVARVVLGVSRTGSSNLLFADDQGNSRVALGLDASGNSSLILPDTTSAPEPADGG